MSAQRDIRIVQDSRRDSTSPYVDWEFAKATGRRLSGAGPKVSRGEAAEVVASLREVATAAREPIAATSLLVSPGDAPEAVVVDRPGWIDANVESMRALMVPVIEKITAGSRDRAGSRAQPGALTAVGGKVTGGEAGALMAFMSGKVLGQYDLAPEGVPRLMLVAPNLVQVERELGVHPHDFRLWVAMHEETHRVQFTAVPWLREHLIDSSRTLTTDLAPTPDELSARLQGLAQRLPEAFRTGSRGLADAFLSPQQRAEVSRITAVMSLLEGHADVMMDEVGPQVIPTVAQIRERFQGRRNGVSGFDRVLRRLLGMEAKMRQYRDGAVFVRAVVADVGLEGFNAVWGSPQTLPTAAEIETPRRWVERVHGGTRAGVDPGAPAAPEAGA
ncbi:zinc-dependent metalloprotease [Dermatophilaceae bacterium Soc4.6]